MQGKYHLATTGRHISKIVTQKQQNKQVMCKKNDTFVARKSGCNKKHLRPFHPAPLVPVIHFCHPLPASCEAPSARPASDIRFACHIPTVSCCIVSPGVKRVCHARMAQKPEIV
jgi:hypothetical protein